MRMWELAGPRIRYGYRKIRLLLNRQGRMVYRLYCEEGLGLRRRPKSRRIASAHSRQKPSAESGLESGFRGRSVTDGRDSGRSQW